MIELTGNYWSNIESYDALICTTNMIVKNDGKLVMGAGIAKDFRDKFPGIDKIWGEGLLTNNHYYGIMNTIWNINGTRRDTNYSGHLISLPTKKHWKENSNMELIKRSCRIVSALAKMMGRRKVLMTRPGCGCGGLHWSHVKKEIKEFLDDRFFIVSKATDYTD